MTIEKEAREIVFKYFDAMTDRQINSGKVRGIEEFIADALQKKQDRIDELESALKKIQFGSCDACGNMHFCPECGRRHYQYEYHDEECSVGKAIGGGK